MPFPTGVYGVRALRAPVRSLTWLLVSFLPWAGGLWAAFGGAYAAHNGYEACLALGSGTLLWLTGLLGVTTAVGHYRWALGVLGNSAVGSPVHWGTAGNGMTDGGFDGAVRERSHH